MVSVPCESRRRDARVAITSSPYEFMKANSANSKTTDGYRSMTASKIAPNSRAPRRSIAPRTPITAVEVMNPTVMANSAAGPSEAENFALFSDSTELDTKVVASEVVAADGSCRLQFPRCRRCT
jgi:subtilisin family serine protease